MDSPFRVQLESAAARLEELAKRSAPMIALAIRREVVTVREASLIVEGAPCRACEGSGTVVRGSAARVVTAKCGICGGTGDL